MKLFLLGDLNVNLLLSNNNLFKHDAYQNFYHSTCYKQTDTYKTNYTSP